MNIRGIHKTSLIDFPGRISAVLFTGGCNLRCRYCHNPALACGGSSFEKTSNEEAILFLKKRKRVIDGVVITGGEPTIASSIESFLEQIKDIPLAVKLDTNGLRPEVLARLIERGLVDYAAIDVKTSPAKYRELTGADVDVTRVAESVDLVRRAGIEYEVRTTCIPDYVTLADLASIRYLIGRVKRYALQQFNPFATLLDGDFECIAPYSEETLRIFKEFVLTFADECEIRGL